MLSPDAEEGDSGVDAVYDDIDAMDGAGLGEGITRLGNGLADASARVTPPHAFEPAHQRNPPNPQNPQNPRQPSLKYLDQPAPARAPLLASAPDAIHYSTHQHHRNPAQVLASRQEPVAAAAAAPQGPLLGPPQEQPPTAQPPILLAQPIINHFCSPALSSSPPLSSPYLPPTSHQALRVISSSLPPFHHFPSSQPPLSSPSPPPDHLGHTTQLASMPKMVFSDLYKSPKSPFAKFRQLHSSSQQQSAHLAEDQQPSELLDYGDPDLLSRDKAKQKEAVRRYLAEKILNDWDFAWPSADVSSAYTGAAKARARAIQKRLVRSEQVGLLDPSETFASPLSPVDGNAPLSLAAVSAAVAADAAAEAGAGDEPNFDEFDSDAESVYSTVSEDAIHFRPRAEWTSDLSEDEKPGAYYQRMPTYVHSPFRFDSPDAVGTAVNIPADERKAKARRDLRAEIVWNEGLACFTARRDAWTGARTVHLKPAKPIAPTSPVSPRRGLFRFHSHTKSEPAPVAAVHTNAVAVAAGGKTNGQDSHSASTTPTAPAQSNSPPGRASSTMPLSPVTSNSRHSQHSQHSHQSQQSAGQETVATTPMTSDCGGGGGVDGAMLQQSASRTSVASAQLGLTRSRASRASRTHPDYSVETIIPVAPPLLPPGNPMRASITPAIYLSLYDKLVSSSLQPSCPINLSDMIRSCVSGWKRDDEWPPRPTEMSAPAVAAMSVALRKKRRDEQREIQKDKRDTANHVGDAGSGGLPSPGLTRRMSNFLGGKPSSGNIILPATTATLAGAGPASPPIDEKDDAGINGQRGIRRSLQRVLGLGYVAHGGGGNTNASIGGHGHSLSVGSVGQSTKQI